MKRLLLIISLALIATYAKAFYTPLKLYSMILNSDRIVYGEIVSIDSTTITFEIQASLTEDNSLTDAPELLTIEKFQNYACAGRWTNYEKHQRLFLFLHTYKGRLMVMGSGNEGELVLLHDSIIIPGITLPPAPPNGLTKKQLKKWPHKDGFNIQHYRVDGYEFYGYKTSLKDFIETVLSIRECFKVESSREYQVITAKLNCDTIIATQKTTSDKIFRWTHSELIK